MNYYYSIVSIEFLINVEGTINFEIEGVKFLAKLPCLRPPRTQYCFVSVTNKLLVEIEIDC